MPTDRFEHRRFGFWRDHITHPLQDALLGLLIVVMRVLALDAASAFGGFVGRKIGLRLRTSRRADQNLRRAMPHLDDAARQRIIRGCGRSTAWSRYGCASARNSGSGFTAAGHTNKHPYPYVFLNLILSMLAALQAPVIMMSQNRQAAKDRLADGLDCEVNLKAEVETFLQLHEKLDHRRIDAVLARLDEQWDQIMLLQRLVEAKADAERGSGVPPP